MKYIEKTNPPEEYLTWCEIQHALGVNYNYDSLPSERKENLHELLLKEQGEICGYTMKRIKKKSSHIEHIKPQNECKKEKGADLDYYNLIACFPQNGSKCSYGAVKKGGWWENNGNDFLSPLNKLCELRVIFYLDGKVTPTNSQSTSTEKTISILNLDEPTLVEERKRSIEEFIFGEEPLNPIQADNAIDIIYLPNEEGRLPEFCIAIHDALYEYLDLLKKLD